MDFIICSLPVLSLLMTPREIASKRYSMRYSMTMMFPWYYECVVSIHKSNGKKTTRTEGIPSLHHLNLSFGLSSALLILLSGLCLFNASSRFSCFFIFSHPNSLLQPKYHLLCIFLFIIFFPFPQETSKKRTILMMIPSKATYDTLNRSWNHRRQDDRRLSMLTVRIKDFKHHQNIIIWQIHPRDSSILSHNKSRSSSSDRFMIRLPSLMIFRTLFSHLCPSILLSTPFGLQ